MLVSGNVSSLGVNLRSSLIREMRAFSKISINYFKCSGWLEKIEIWSEHSNLIVIKSLTKISLGSLSKYNPLWLFENSGKSKVHLIYYNG